MDGALPPPRPGLLAGEGQERREEPQQHAQGDLQAGAGAGSAGVVAVGAVLHQLHVVVGEVPEEPLGAFQGPCVVEGLEGLGGAVEQFAEVGQQRPVDRLGHRTGLGCPVAGVSGFQPPPEWRSRGCVNSGQSAVAAAPRAGKAQHEAGGVEDLDGQAPPHLDLRLVEGCVGAGAPACRPVAHRVGAVALQQTDRRDDVALRLGHLLAVRDRAPSRRWPPVDHGTCVVLEMGSGSRWRTARCG